MSKAFDAGIRKLSKSEIDAAAKWRIRDSGIGAFAWADFRYWVGCLSVREKLRPAHWQRDLASFFMGHIAVAGLPQDEALVARVVTEMMNESRSWCNPQIGVDEGPARLALRKAFDTILAAQDSTGTDGPSVDSGSLPEPVDVRTRTAELARELGL